MNIVIVNRWFPPVGGWGGGVRNYNYTIAQAYRDLGHQVTVIASKTTVSSAPVREIDGIQVQRLLIRDAYRLRRVPGLRNYVRPIQHLDYSLRIKRAVQELGRRQSIDIIESAEVGAESFFYLRKPDVPVVIRCHTPTFMLEAYYRRGEIPGDTRLIRWCEKDTIHRAMALTTPSRDLAQMIAARCSIPVEKIVPIPNPVNLTGWGDTTTEVSDRVTILYVGRLERVKGASVLADAIPQVVARVPNAQFVLIGDDRPNEQGSSRRAELEKQFAKSNVSDRVRILGMVDQASLIDWYRRSDICVVPSMLYESFSYTCAQAMGAGKPVVASRIGGIPETVDDGVNGTLVTPGDAKELAHAIIPLADDKDLRRRMGSAGREKVIREFDPIRVAAKNLQVYQGARIRYGTTS